MPRASTVHAVIAIGVDLGKSTLHMIGLDSCGAIVLRDKVSRYGSGIPKKERESFRELLGGMDPPQTVAYACT